MVIVACDSLRFVILSPDCVVRTMLLMVLHATVRAGGSSD
jgi:hypothetical protein